MLVMSSSSSWKTMLGVGLVVVGICAASYPIVIAPLMNKRETDIVRDPRLDAGYKKPSMWKVSLLTGGRL